MNPINKGLCATMLFITGVLGGMTWISYNPKSEKLEKVCNNVILNNNSLKRTEYGVALDGRKYRVTIEREVYAIEAGNSKILFNQHGIYDILSPEGYSIKDKKVIAEAENLVLKVLPAISRQQISDLERAAQQVGKDFAPPAEAEK